jgi:DNA-binding NarL/FixJ family response regulator
MADTNRITELLSPQRMARILIADDHPEARRGARELLEAHPGWEVCGEAVNGVEAIEKAAALKPDIVILDLSMPKMSGSAAARVIRSTAPDLPLLLFSLYAGDPLMNGGFRAAGFSGDLNKAAADLLIEAVETLLQGGTYFQSSAMPRAIVSDEATTGSDQPPTPSADTTHQASLGASPNASAEAAPTATPDSAPGNSSSDPC